MTEALPHSDTDGEVSADPPLGSASEAGQVSSSMRVQKGVASVTTEDPGGTFRPIRSTSPVEGDPMTSSAGVTTARSKAASLHTPPSSIAMAYNSDWCPSSRAISRILLAASPIASPLCAAGTQWLTITTTH